MSLVENEITQANVERARNNAELEQYNEIEQKLTPSKPEVFEELFKSASTPIEQIYLSSPWDEFSQRVRCVYETWGPEYTAAQKDRGELQASALKRQEIPTEISAETFAFYQSMDLPKVLKLRTKVMPGVTVDFYDDDSEPVIVEVEHNDPQERERLITLLEEMTNDTLTDRSDDPALTNEAIAYRLSGIEHPRKPEALDDFTHRVLGEILAQYAIGKKQVVTGLTGMSGSGKTTVANALSEQIVEMFGEQYRPAVISTDDYHYGKEALEQMYGAPYTTWDAARTYDTSQLAADLEALSEGTPLIKRHFDFDSEEVVYDKALPVTPFVIIEGVHASSKDLEEVRDLHFQLPTSPATSIGRDNRRLIIDNRSNRAFPTAPDRFRYQIEKAYPAYLELQAEFPKPKAFSASSRTMTERAFVLTRYAALNN